MKYLTLFVALFLACYILFCPERRTAVGEGLYEEIKQNQYGKSNEPKWRKYNRIREVSDPGLGVILGDLESHIFTEHHYGDANKVVWAHQVSHGINARLRNDPTTGDGWNGFYVLQDRSIILKEPEVTVRDVAVSIPANLRESGYGIYLLEQATTWNDRPLYLLDEWVAFTNASDCGRELNIKNWSFELLQAHEFSIYCMTLAMVVQRDCSDYRDTELREFIMWNVERVFRLTHPSDRSREEVSIGRTNIPVSNWHICPHPIPSTEFSGGMKEVDLYLNKVRTSPDAEKLRTFAKDYFGEEWCRKVYGF